MFEKKSVKSLLCLLVALSLSATATMGADILFLTSSDPTHMPGDDALKAFIESLGHTVTYFDDGEDEASTEAAAAAADLVFMSESVGSSQVNNEITEIEVPMVITESYAWDEMGLTEGGGQAQNVVTTDIEIIDPGHYLAAGFSGTVTVLTDITGARGPARFGNGIAGDEADVIATATLVDGQTYDFVFVYEKGAAVAQAPADGSDPFVPDVRVCLGFDEQSYVVWNENAFVLLEAAINYALGMTEARTQARNPDPRDSSLLPDTWVNLSWSPGDLAVSHDVYLGDNFDDVNDGIGDTFVGNQAATFIVVGFPGFPYPDGLVPGTTYYWRIDEVNDTEPNSPWKGNVWSFSIPPKTAYYPDPADAAESVDPDVQLSWTGGFGAKLHTVYFGDNFDDVENATGGLPQGTTTYTPDTLKLAKTYYWRVDEFDALETYKGDVWSFTTEGAVGRPNPANGAVDVKQTQIITFSPSVFAASHELYFGTDKDAVKNADTGSPEYKGSRNLGDESYDPGMLEWDTTYYWRVDAVNDASPDSPWTGILWSFTTANFLVVDDFESYNDIDPPDPESNRIFEAWLDGYEIPTNGALVGNELPPYAEQRIVHSGFQSMPYFYDNSVGYSEATLTLTYPRDWTENGVNKLTIWFRGNSDNAAETLYIALNGSAVVNHENSNAAQTGGWTEWSIPLQAFADQGVNLANVNTISLGFGDKNNPQAGGSGTMYFDDIRLYPLPPTP
ncbi:MAG: hypothetical protein ACETWQ_10490 [Phycisphaerae bacterium]